jgi:transcription antitermination factor NusG
MKHVTKKAVARPINGRLGNEGHTTFERGTAPWYALCIRQRQREHCESYLTSHSYKYFSPVLSEMHLWSDRRKAVRAPLFPGYLFCQFDPHQSLPILRAPGVTSIVCSAGKLLEVDATELSHVDQSLQAGMSVDVITECLSGQRVRIIAGALMGIEGVIVVAKNQFRIGLAITMMNRSVLVEVSPSQVVSL